jgi:hypothetical protein
MLKSQFVLAATFLVFGSSVVLAESSNTSPVGSLSVKEYSVLSANEQESKTKQEKLDILESKVEELEARMENLFPLSFIQQQGFEPDNNPYGPQMVRTMQGWSSKDHLVEAKASQQEADILKKKIQKLQSRIDRFSQKPYLDTKGFKRSGLEILKGNLTQELRETTKKTAWHQSQAKTIMISESKHQQRS